MELKNIDPAYGIPTAALPFTVEVSNVCSCSDYVCPKCGELNGTPQWQVEQGKIECWNCAHEMVLDELEQEPGDCEGMECWEPLIEDVQQMWEDFIAAHPASSGHYLVEGEGMGWRHRSGYRAVSEDDTPHEMISVNTEWTQRWTLDEQRNLTATQSHHDAMGESYTFRPLTNAEYDKMEQE